MTTALYEGLVDYAPDSSNKIVPSLAESWTVSSEADEAAPRIAAAVRPRRYRPLAPRITLT